ncbi:MAG: PIN domain-containing protein [Anaerolineales bacterium]|nr:PIN domain-containing protein [Anaerolineales bacterium]
MKILVDLNVLLDVLGRRETHYEGSAEVWGAVERRDAEGLIAAHSITTLHYLIGRNVDGVTADNVVQDCLKVFSIAAIGQDVIQEAIGYRWSDFENAVQMAVASRGRADYLVTRNPKDFEGGPVTVLQP